MNHPNIAQIYGLETSGNIRALVMELVPGPTLADRLESGPLSLAESLSFALQIAQALEEAHDKGIIHRDLKPQNIKASSEGKVKVLDFGLAKAMDSSTGAASVADLARSPTIMNSPTLTAVHGTQLGVILGTAAYMAPEQAKGHPTDKRADIWAFGVVLHEMLSGRRLFAGDSVAETLAGVLKSEIDWKALPEEIPVAIRQLLRRCLERNPRNRLHDIADARIVLDEVASGVAEAAAPAAAPAKGVGARVLAGAAAAALVLGAVAGWLAHRVPPAPVATARWALAIPDGYTLSSAEFPQLALSSDGRQQVAVVVGADAMPRLLLRSAYEFEPRFLPDTERASSPVFSPDGRWVAYFRDGDLYRLATSGGAPVRLAKATVQPRGVTWSRDGFLYFSPDSVSGLSRVPEGGGVVAPVTTPDGAANERTHRWPSALPDGSALIFTNDSQASSEFYDDARIEAVRLATGERKLLVEGASSARWSPGGELVFARGGALYAVAFDVASLSVHGPPRLVAQGVATDVGSGAVQFDVSASGDALWAPGGFTASYAFAWMSRDGVEARIDLPPAPYNEAELSPDGRRVVLTGGEGGVADLWVADLERGTTSRLTIGEQVESPIWSRDGGSIAYAARRQSRGQMVAAIHRRPADGSRDAEQLLEHARMIRPNAFTTDGFLIYSAMKIDGDGDDIFRLSPDGGEPELLVGGPYSQAQAALSPDERWLAYVSDEGGRSNVFVRPYRREGGALAGVGDAGSRTALGSRRSRAVFSRRLDAVPRGGRHLARLHGQPAGASLRPGGFGRRGAHLRAVADGRSDLHLPLTRRTRRAAHAPPRDRLRAADRGGGAEAMTIAVGSRIGPHEITAKLGEGGMGEVWRATDTRLDRDVAIKVLPAAFTRRPGTAGTLRTRGEAPRAVEPPEHRPDLRPRDQRRHPRSRHGARRRPDARRTPRIRAFSITESLSTALQIAQALEEAHEKGIVHRDLKPQNIKASSEGKVKVLDFGLAKAMDSTGTPTAALANSPTLTAVRGTELGTILGTAAYMAPEQARGRTVDKRVDIWAFGVVFYEMLTGEQLFAGESVVDTLSAVLTKEIDLTRLPAELSPRLRELVRRCLERDPKRRLRDIGEARLLIERVLAGAAGSATGEPAEVAVACAWLRAAAGTAGPAETAWKVSTPSRSFLITGRRVGIAAAIAGAALIGLAAGRSMPSSDPVHRSAKAIRAAIALPPGLELDGVGAPEIALSPDGSTLAFLARGASGPQHLYVRRLDSDEAKLVPGSESAEGPFFSPDGDWVAFAVGVSGLGGGIPRELRKQSLESGLTQTIAPIQDYFGGVWRDDGTIFFIDASDGTVSSVPASGGKPTLAAARDERPRRAALGVPLLARAVAGRWGARPQHARAPGWRAGGTRSRFGGPHPPRRARHESTLPADRAPRLRRRERIARGRAVRRRGAPGPRRSGGGTRRDRAGAQPLGDLRGRHRRDSGLCDRLPEQQPPRTDAGGSRLARRPVRDPGDRARSLRPRDRGHARTGGGWRWRAKIGAAGSSTSRGARGPRLPATKSPARWMSPGRPTATSSPGARSRRRVTTSPCSFSRATDEELRGRSACRDSDLSVAGWMPDGRELVVTRWGVSATIERVPLAGESEVVWRDPGSLGYSDLSPDGRLVAFESDAGEGYEVYLYSFATGERTPVTAGGGRSPFWSHDGRELFFRRGSGILAAEISTAADGSLRIGRETRLFDWPAAYKVVAGADGSFFGTEPVPSTARQTSLQLQTRWFESVRRLAPAGNGR